VKRRKNGNRKKNLSCRLLEYEWVSIMSLALNCSKNNFYGKLFSFSRLRLKGIHEEIHSEFIKEFASDGGRDSASSYQRRPAR